MNIVIEMVGLVDKILQEYFGEVKIEYVDTDIENFKVVYAEDETRLVFTFTRTAVKVEFKSSFGFEGSFTIPIDLKKVNNKQKLEEILRKELDSVLGVIFRRAKLKQTIKQYIEQKLHLKDIKIQVVYDYEQYDHKHKAMLRVFTPIPLVLDIEYKWDMDKKIVSDVEIRAIGVFTDDKLRELVFNAILSYYLLS